MSLSDELNRTAETEMIAKLEEVLDVNYLNSDELKPFQALAASVHEQFVEQGIISADDIQRARDIANGLAQ
jgi:hypothetical protein